MHTWRRADGSYYDAVEPEDENHEPLPLRPSEVHQWDGRRWVWKGKTGITHGFPRLDDVCRSSVPELIDLARLVHEQAEILDYHSRNQKAMREDIATLGRKIDDHLTAAQPLIEGVEGMKAIRKAAGSLASVINAFVTVVSFVWRVGLVLVGVYALGWAIVHGDIGAIRRAFALIVQ